MALHSFGLPSHALVDYHLERSGMQFHDKVEVNCSNVFHCLALIFSSCTPFAVGVNCKRDATTENQCVGAWYMG